MPQPLTGLRVLELGRVVAAPAATQMLADLGADVVKVERPDGGDYVRALGPPFLADRDGRPTPNSAIFLAYNRNKRSIALDLTLAHDQQVLRDLAADADVLVENFRVGALARYGLDYPSLAAVNPDLVYCSITGYGQDGPYARLAAADPGIQAMSGLMSLTGEPEGDPQRVGLFVADLLAGEQAAFAIVAALFARDRSDGPGGRHIDISLLDVAVTATSNRMQEYLLSGAIPERLGSRTTPVPLSEPLGCADGLLFVTASTDEKFTRLCTGIGRPDLAKDGRFATREARTRNRTELLQALAPLFVTRTVAEWQDVVSGLDLVCAPVNDLAEVLRDPQVRHRRLVHEVDHPVAGPTRVLGSAIRMSDTQPTYRPPPMPGEHTDEILEELARRRAERG